MKAGTVDLSVAPDHPKAAAEAAAPCRGCDILFISICSLRRDHLGAYGGPPGQTPTLDALAASAQRFDQAWSTSNFTLAAVTSMLTGRFPSGTGVVRWGTGLGPEIALLPEILGWYGYRTGAFTVDAASGLRPEYGLARGFQRFVVIPPTRSTPDGRHHGGSPGPPGETAAPLVQWLEAQPTDQPVFALLHTRSAHYPFVLTPPEAGQDPTGVRAVLWEEPVEGERGDLRPGTAGAEAVALAASAKGDPVQAVVREAGAAGIAEWKAAYAESVARMDADVAAALQAQRDRGRLDQTVVVVVADHGESLGDNGELLHGGGYFDGVIHVPLLISVPGQAPGVQSALVSHVDLAPTLLDLVGAVVPAGIDWRSLLPLLRGEVAAVRDTALSEGGPNDAPIEAFPGAVVHPPWVYMRQPTPCTAQAPQTGPDLQRPQPPGGPGRPPPQRPPPVGGAGRGGLHSCLFNLTEDPLQQHNVADQHPQVTADLQARWDGYRAATASQAGTRVLALDPSMIKQVQESGYDFSSPAPGGSDGATRR